MEEETNPRASVRSVESPEGKKQLPEESVVVDTSVVDANSDVVRAAVVVDTFVDVIVVGALDVVGPAVEVVTTVVCDASAVVGDAVVVGTFVVVDGEIVVLVSPSTSATFVSSSLSIVTSWRSFLVAEVKAECQQQPSSLHSSSVVPGSPH